MSEIKKDWSNGDLVDADDLNNNFDTLHLKSITNFTADENINGSVPVRVRLGSATRSHQTPDSATAYLMNNSGSITRRSNKYVAGSTNEYWNEIKLFLTKVGNPGNLTVEVRESNATGTLIATVTVAQGTITHNAENTITFASIFKLSAGSTYHVVLIPQTADGSNYYGWHGTATSGGAGDNNGIYTGSWSYTLLPYLYLIMSRTDGTSGRIYRAKSSSQGEVDLFVGFTVESVTSGNSVEVQSIGNLGGFSSLESVPTTYYLQDTVGTIGTSAGTVSLKVGKSINSTRLSIVPVL